MRISRIRITGYGRFLDWESGEFSPGLNVITGPNEAGKSTLRAFLLDVLFGFQPKVRGRHPYNPWHDSNVDFGGEIEMETPDGRRLRLRRYLRGRLPFFECIDLESGATLLEGDLHGVIPVSREMYARLFALDLRELTELDERAASEIVERFAADFETLGEIASPTKALADLKVRITKLGRKDRRGKQPLITRLEQELKEVRKEFQQAREEAARLPELYERRERLQDEAKTARSELIHCKTLIERLQTTEPLRKALGAIREVEEQLAALADAPEIPREEFDRLQSQRVRLDGLRESLAQSRDEEKAAAAELGEVEKEAEKVAAVLELGEDEIEATCARIEEIVRQREEETAAAEQASALREEMRRAAAVLRADGDADAIVRGGAGGPEAVPRLESLLDQAAEIEQTLASTRGRYETVRAAASETEDEVQRLTSAVPEDFPADFSVEWLSAAERAADLARDLRELRNNLETRREERAAAEDEFRRAAAQTRAVRAGIAVPAAGVLCAAAGAVVLASGLPSAPGWTLVVTGAAAAVAGAFWSAVSRIRREQAREATRVLIQRLDEDIRRLTGELERGTERLRELVRKARIRDIAEDVGDDFAVPEEALDTLRRWSAAAGSAARLAEARERLEREREVLRKEHAAVEELEQKIEAVWSEYAQTCGTLGIDPPADRNLSAERRRLNVLARLLEQRTRLEAVEKRREQLRQRLEARLDEVGPVLERLGIGRKEPDAATAARLRSLLRQAVSTRQRRESAARELRRVRGRVERLQRAIEKEEQAFLKRLAELGVESPEALEKAFTRSEERRDLERRRAELERFIGEHRERMGEMLGEEGSGEPGPPSEHGEPAESANEPGGLSEQRIIERIEQLREREQECERRIAQIEEQLGAVEREIGEIEKKADVEVLRSRMAGIEARLAEMRRRRDVLVLTEYLLREAVHAFEKEHRLPVLERAGDYLEKFTGGRYSELRIDREKKGAQVLRSIEVVAASGGVPRPIDSLSRGTAEQVYLALRLALAVEMAGGRPLPFVLDDVLVNADPERLHGCVGRLADFAEQTQVLAFTCHPHVAKEFEAAGAHAIPLGS